MIRYYLILIFLLLCCQRCLGSTILPSTNIAGGASYEEFDFDPQTSKRRNLTLGKDRELFYASIDFKWLFQRLTDVDSMMGFGRKILISLLNLVRGADPNEVNRKNALEIWSYIRNVQRGSNLK